MSVGGLESLLRGRHMISQSEFDALYEDEKRGARAGNTGLVVRPDNMWSWAGIKFLATGYIPLHHWTKMVVSWGSYVMLILVATLAVAVIMRRQWVDNERYPMPIGQMAMALVGNDDGDNPFSAIWRNRIMWLGFGLALFWCLMKGWRQFNGDVPNMNISVQLKPYLEGAQWGQAWTDIYFNVYAIILALAIFMELNVLISIATTISPWENPSEATSVKQPILSRQNRLSGLMSAMDCSSYSSRADTSAKCCAPR
jgi:hypothetical protein